MLDWIDKNKDWLLQGVGVLIPIAIVAGIWAVYTFRKSREREKSRGDSATGLHQTQQSGDDSTNYQAGGNITIDQPGDRGKSNEGH